MADKTIPQLPELTTVTNETLFATDSGTQSFKLKAENVRKYTSSNLQQAMRLMQQRFSDVVTKTWVDTNPGDLSWRQIAYSPKLKMFVATAQNMIKVLAQSALGTWVTGSSATAQRGPVIWHGAAERFIVFNMTDHGLAYSTNGTSWTAANTGTSEGCDAACYAEKGIALIISDGQSYTSADGSTWTQGGALPASMSWQSVCYAPALDLFVAVASDGSGNTIAISDDDGATWTGVANPSDAELSSVCWSEELGLFVAGAYLGTNRIWTSVDGANWLSTTIPTLQTAEIASVVWAAELSCFVAVGGDFDSAAGVILKSYDGITWWLVSMTGGNMTAVAWGGNFAAFCAVVNAAMDNSKKAYLSDSAFLGAFPLLEPSYG